MFDRKAFANGFLGAATALVALVFMGPTFIHVPTKNVHPHADVQGEIAARGYDPGDCVTDPDLSLVATISGHQVTPLLPRRYWTTDDAGLTWRPMDAGEIAAVDSATEGSYFGGGPQVVADTGLESLRFVGPKGARKLRVRWADGTTTDVVSKP